MEDLQERLTNCEIKIAHQERLLETLNDVLVEQRRELDQFRKTLDQVQAQVLSSGESPANEPPPHY